MSDNSSIPLATTHHVRDHCLCLHVQRAARTVARRFDEAFRPLDLNNKQFSLMMSLNRPSPPSIGAVAAGLGMDRTTLTAALKPLERRGLVTAMPNPQDRRSSLLALTADGRELLARAVPIWEATHREVGASIAAMEPEALRAALRELSGTATA